MPFLLKSIADSHGPSTEGARRSDVAGYAAALTTWFTGAITFIIVQGLSSEMPPWTITLVRVMLLMPLLWLLVSHQKDAMLALLRQRWVELLVIGALGMGLQQGILFNSLQMTSAMNVSIIYALTPMITLIFARIALGEPMTSWQAFGSAMAFTGVVLITVDGSWARLAAFGFGAGDLVAFLAAANFAFYTILLRRARFDLAPLPLLTLLQLGALIVLVPASLWEVASGQPMSLSWHTVWGLLYVAVVGGGVMKACYNYSVAELGASRAGTMIYTHVIFVTVISWAFLGQQFAWYHAVGGGLIAGGILLVVRMRPNAGRAG